MDSPRPLGAYELLARVERDWTTAPTSIYRALDSLIAAGKVHRIESLRAFVACRDRERDDRDSEHSPTIGFAICDRCGSVDEFADPAIRPKVEVGVSVRDFAPRTITVEVHGLCAECRSTETGAPS